MCVPGKTSLLDLEIYLLDRYVMFSHVTVTAPDTWYFGGKQRNVKIVDLTINRHTDNNIDIEIQTDETKKNKLQSRLINLQVSNGRPLQVTATNSRGSSSRETPRRFEIRRGRCDFDFDDDNNTWARYFVLYYSLSNRKSRGGKINIARSSPPLTLPLPPDAERLDETLVPGRTPPPTPNRPSPTLAHPSSGRRPTGTSTYTHSDIGLAHARTRGHADDIHVQ